MIVPRPVHGRVANVFGEMRFGSLLFVSKPNPIEFYPEYLFYTFPFSTETQTDEMEILPRLANDDAFNMIEAQTQFDLDDILCSNCSCYIVFFIF